MTQRKVLGPLVGKLAGMLEGRPGSGRLLALLAAALLSALLVAAFQSRLLTLEENLGALGWTLAPDASVEQRITLVTIDEKSLAQVGAWPWPRAEMARLVESLDAAGVQLQVHDIVYSEPRPGDGALVAALGAANNSLIAQLLTLEPEAAVRVGAMTHPVSGDLCTGSFPAAGGFIAAEAGFAAIAKGHITPLIDADGAIRKIPGVVCLDGQAYPALPVAALLKVLGRDDWRVSVRDGRGIFEAPQVLELEAYPGMAVPLDRAGNLRISYRRAPQSFRAVSAVDVMNGDVDPAMLENTWVVVGASAFGIGDIVPTPYSGATPGLELQARLLSSILDDAVPYTPRSAWWWLAGLSAAFALLLFLLAGARGRTATYGLPAAGIALPVAALALHIQLLSSQDLWLGWLYPALFSLVAAGALLVLEQKRLRLERTRVFNNLSSYLPVDVAHDIAFSLPSSSINARRCETTILCADLRNFSAFGEARPPEESAALLHFFFVRATEIVERHNGRIQEFKGDGLLAVWDRQDAWAAEQALLAAQEMQRVIHADILPEHLQPGLEPLALGIGIEQGPALIGSIGPASRRTHTLLGDTVTITIRIQDMTAELAQPILIGECAARHLNDWGLDSQGSYLLAGLRIPHALFAPPATVSNPDRASHDSRLRVIRGGRS